MKTAPAPSNSSRASRTAYCVRMSAIGDVVIVSRSLLALKEAGFHVVFVTSKHLLPLAQRMDFLEEVIGLDSSSMEHWVRDNGGKTWIHESQIRQRTEKAQTVLVDFHCTSRSRRAISRLRETGMEWNDKITVPKRRLFRQSLLVKASLKSRLKGQFCANESAVLPHLQWIGESVLSLQLEALSRLTGKSFVEWQTERKKSDAKIFPSAILPKETPSHDVLLFPGASLPLKKWPLENCVAFLNHVLKGKHSAALLGGDEEKQFAEELKKQIPKLVSYVGETDLPQTLSMIQAAKSVVTTDSFPAHVCDVLNKPCVVLFGATSPRFGFMPHSENVEIHSVNTSCSPCSLHGKGKCHFDNFKCMTELDGVLVARRILEMI